LLLIKSTSFEADLIHCSFGYVYPYGTVGFEYLERSNLFKVVYVSITLQQSKSSIRQRGNAWKEKWSQKRRTPLLKLELGVGLSFRQLFEVEQL